MKVNKSQMMREMFATGKLPAEVSKLMNVNYAYCYGVYSRWMESQGKDYHITNNTDTKSQLIRDMYDAGNTAGEISKELNTNYTYVWNVINKHRKAQN